MYVEWISYRPAWELMNGFMCKFFVGVPTKKNSTNSKTQRPHMLSAQQSRLVAPSLSCNNNNKKMQKEKKNDLLHCRSRLFCGWFLWRLAGEGKDTCVGINSSLATKRCFPVLEAIDLTCLPKRFAADDKLSVFGFDVTKQSLRVYNLTPTQNQVKCVFPNVSFRSKWPGLSLGSCVLLPQTLTGSDCDLRLPSCLPLWQK